MLVEKDAAALLEIILVSNDVDHARVLMTDLDMSKLPFTVTHVTERRGIRPALERLTRKSRRSMPVIVMLDFDFVQDSCEELAARVVDLKNQLAIECIVTRPPPFGQLVDRLGQIGAFLFDPDADVAPPLRLLH